MGKFLKQSPALKSWASKFKLQAQTTLSMGAVIKKNYRGKGALGRSIRTTLRDGANSVEVDIFYNWYGNLVEAGGPFGPRRTFIRPRPWFQQTFNNLNDELVRIIENDIAEGLYAAIDAKP
jgi:hypothetical protein